MSAHRYLSLCTTRYDTIHYIYVCSEGDQLNLPHGTKQKRVMMKLKTSNRDAQKRRSSDRVRGVSPVAGRESMVGRKICERGRSRAGSEREGVVDGESGKLTE